jgi:hypothetical protein
MQGKCNLRAAFPPVKNDEERQKASCIRQKKTSQTIEMQRILIQLSYVFAGIILLDYLFDSFE